jgi:hypothetical protein
MQEGLQLPATAIIYTWQLEFRDAAILTQGENSPVPEQYSSHREPKGLFLALSNRINCSLYTYKQD